MRIFFILLLNLTLLLAENLTDENLSKNNPDNSKEDFLKLALGNYSGERSLSNPLSISSYKMNYFLPLSYGFNFLGKEFRPVEAKFQLSVKKKLGEDLFGLDERYYFAYTQTSWWQLYDYSSPFRETNYQPEAFIDFPLDIYNFVNLRLGLLHESNGKSDKDLQSRSWNRFYLGTVFMKDRFLIIPRVWFRIPESKRSDDNPDITHYLGNFDINLAYLGKDFFANTMIRNNFNFSHNKGAVQVDLGYDIFDNGIFWYLQYFNGYGESLIDYNRHLQKLSTGFLISY